MTPVDLAPDGLVLFDFATPSLDDASARVDATGAVDAGAVDATATPGDAAGSDATASGDAPPPPLNMLTNTHAYITNGREINLLGDTVPSTASVSITTQKQAVGAVKQIRLFYSLDPTGFTNPQTIVMPYDKLVAGFDQWYGVIPAQAQGSHVAWYIQADGLDGTTLYYSNFGANFDYFVN